MKRTAPALTLLVVADPNETEAHAGEPEYEDVEAELTILLQSHVDPTQDHQLSSSAR